MPTITERRILVAGVTGRFGAVADLLLARGHRVLGMSRNPGSPEALALAEHGIQVVFGDFDRPDTIERAAERVDAVIAGGTAHRAGPEGELRHGRNLADAVARAGVRQFVYISGDGANPGSPLALFRTKAAIEEHIRSLGVPSTILAPVYFMENLFNPWNLPALGRGVLPTPVPVDLPLAQVALADLLAVAALAVERPEEFVGQRVVLASDEVTGLEAAAQASELLGREVTAEQLEPERLPPGLRALFGWLGEVGHSVDIAGLRRAYPTIGWHTYAAWFASVVDRVAAVSAASSPSRNPSR